MKIVQLLNQCLVTEKTRDTFKKVPKILGSLGYDPWGYHEESVQVAFTIAHWFYEHYFRVSAIGLENIPPQGRLMVIGNHSGQLPLDALMIGTAAATNEGAPRMLRGMVERFFPTVPFLGNWINQWGGVVGDPINCVRLLEKEEAVLVFPEGVRGSGKPWKHRYQLQRFGTGFMKIAIETQTPIVPVGVVGCEETMPSLGNLRPLAQLLQIPYFPITFPFPLPQKVVLNFGKPINFQGDPDSEKQVRGYVEEIKTEISQLIKNGFQLKQEMGYA